MWPVFNGVGGQNAETGESISPLNASCIVYIIRQIDSAVGKSLTRTDLHPSSQSETRSGYRF